MRIFAIFMTIAGLAFTAVAQTAPAANGQQFGDWTLRCVAQGVGETSCALGQTLNAADSGAFVAEVGLTVRDTDDGARVLMILLTPEGVALDLRPAYVVDDAGEQKPLIWRTCAQSRCRAAVLLTREEAAKLKAGGRIIVGFQGFGAETPIRVAVSLNGVTAGLNALGYE